jgi:DNA invertase Pin-like site-specific DNA recombinase
VLLAKRNAPQSLAVNALRFANTSYNSDSYELGCMLIFAYAYSDPLLEPVATIDPQTWGQPIDRLYHDWGDRTQLHQLLADCQTELVEMIFIRRLAELGDSVAEVSDRLATLEAQNISVIAIDEPIGGETLRRSDLLAVLRSVQGYQQQQKLKQGHAKNRIKALPPPGKAPYGYKRGKQSYLLDRTTAPVVKEFFEHFLLYGSLRGSVRFLQKTYGKKISVSTGQRWLSSPVYRGDLVYHTGDVIRETHPAILSRQEAAQIDRLLRRNKLLPPRSTSAPRSLSGLVCCGTCQSPMTVTRVTARGKEREYLYLRPTACAASNQNSDANQVGNAKTSKPCGAIAYADFLDATIEQICQTLPKLLSGESFPDLDAIRQSLAAAIAQKQVVLDQLPQLVTQGVLDEATAELRAYRLRTEIAQLQAKGAGLPPGDLQAIAQAVSIRQFWLDLSEAERRFYFREFIRQIEWVKAEGGWTVKLQFFV